MAERLPSLRPAEVVAALQRCGLTLRRQKGSRVIMWKPGLRRPVVVASHTREISPALLAKILSQAQVDVEQFLRSLR